MKPLHLLVAPDKFKGSLSADAATRAMERGAKRACPDAIIDACPLSDGGEGIATVLVAALGGTFREETVAGPLGEPVEACWAMLGDSTTAVVESAEAIGLSRVAEDERAPLATTSYGVGELVRAAVRAGAKRVLVGLGGTATTDAGVGLAQALGVFLSGVGTPARARELASIRRVELGARDPVLAGVELIALCDVDNPLGGAEGAARVYGPQKGATETDIVALEAGFGHLSELMADAGHEPGDGAAGGLGYGLRVFAGARLVRGVEFVLDAVRFDVRLDASDLVLTGEGRLDAQSARGKVVTGVARRCRERGVPAIALAGAIERGSALDALGLAAANSLTDGGVQEAVAKERAAELLEVLAEDVMRRFARGASAEV